MAKTAAQSVAQHSQALEYARQTAILVGASLFIALCARVTLPLPFTPVPLSLQNFGVLLVGMLMGSRRGFTALALYLAQGAAGLQVFASNGPGGLAQVLGPTGGYLLAYPFVAGLAGWVMERGKKSFARAVMAGALGEVVLFAAGIGWLFLLTHSFAQAVRFGLYWFIFAEIIKVMAAAGMAARWQRAARVQP